MNDVLIALCSAFIGGVLGGLVVFQIVRHQNRRSHNWRDLDSGGPNVYRQGCSHCGALRPAPRDPSRPGRTDLPRRPLDRQVTYQAYDVSDDESGDVALGQIEDEIRHERSRYGACRECGAAQDEWCRTPGCTLLDRWDYR